MHNLLIYERILKLPVDHNSAFLWWWRSRKSDHHSRQRSEVGVWGENGIGLSEQIGGGIAIVKEEDDSEVVLEDSLVHLLLAEVLALKHMSMILGQWSNPVSGSRKGQASSPWAKQHRVPSCSIMEKPHTGLDDCPTILLSCFRARSPACLHRITVELKVSRMLSRLDWLDGQTTKVGGLLWLGNGGTWVGEL